MSGVILDVYVAIAEPLDGDCSCVVTVGVDPTAARNALRASMHFLYSTSFPMPLSGDDGFSEWERAEWVITTSCLPLHR